MNFLAGLAKAINTVVAVAQRVVNSVAPKSKLAQGFNQAVNTVSNVTQTLTSNNSSSGNGGSGSGEDASQSKSPTSSSNSGGEVAPLPPPKPVDPLAEKKRDLERAAARARDILGDPAAMFDLANQGVLASYAIEDTSDRSSTLLALHPSTQMKVGQLSSLLGLDVATDDPMAAASSIRQLAFQQQLANNQATLNAQTQQLLSEFDQSLKRATNQYFEVPTPYMWQMLQEDPQQFGIFDKSIDSEKMSTLNPLAASFLLRDQLIKSAAQDGIPTSKEDQSLPMDFLISQIYTGYKNLDAEKYPYRPMTSEGVFDGDVWDGDVWSKKNPEDRRAWAKRRDELVNLWYSWTREPLSDAEVMSVLHLEDTPENRLVDGLGSESIREELHHLETSYLDADDNSMLPYDPSWDTASYEDLVSIWRGQLYHIQGERENWNPNSLGYQTQAWQQEAYAQSLEDDRTYWKLEGLDRTDLADFTLVEIVLSVVFEPIDWAVTGIAAFSAAAEGRTGDAVGMLTFAALPFVTGRMHGMWFAPDEILGHGMRSMPSNQADDVIKYMDAGLSREVAEAMAKGDLIKPSLKPSVNAIPRGETTELPKPVPENDPKFYNVNESIESLNRENIDAKALRQKYGFDVLQNPTKQELKELGFAKWNTKKPDLVIEGTIFDVVTPTPDGNIDGWNAYDRITDKLKRGQANGIVLDLSRSEVAWETVKDILETPQVPEQALPGNLKQIIVIKDGVILDIWKP